MAKDYSKMNKEELLEEIKKLESRKSYGLVWEDKPEEIIQKCEKMLPVLGESRKNYIDNNNEKLTHLIIEGDNYHSLSSLNYTHRSKIDVIYIDPPYNTGGKDFSYNDHYVDKEDVFRHSKWLSFMEARLKLAKNLLTEEGSIFVQIDANELANLRLLLDEIFGPDNFRSQIVWLRSSSGKTVSRSLSEDTDYILWYTKGPNYIFNSVYKPLSENTKKMYSKNDNDGRGFYRLYPLQKTGSPGPQTTYDYKDNNGKVWKCPAKGWRMKESKLRELENDGRLFLKGRTISEKAYWNERENEGQIANNLWNDIPNIQGSSSEKVSFTGGQKPIKLIQRILKMTGRKDSLVLDFFAGSGSTGHAVIDLNSEDGGERKFILCTNNENKIAEEITFPRIKEVINKYSKEKNLKNNVRYYKTEFVDVESVHNVSDQKKIELTYQAGRMIALREDTLEETEKNDWWQIFTDKQGKTTAIYFKEDKDKLDELVEKIRKSDHAALYIFSWGKNEYKNEYTEYKNIRVEDIPEPILEVYKEINKK